MRVLLDEQLDRRLKPLFDPDLDVVTVRERGGEGRRDGDPLRAAADEFDALDTMDRGIPHQQNVPTLARGIVLVRAWSNRRADLAPLVPQVSDALRKVRPAEVVVVGG